MVIYLIWEWLFLLFLNFYNDEHPGLKGNLLSPHLSLRCQSALMSVRIRRTGVTNLRATTRQITPCWERRACSGHGVWVRKVLGGRGWTGTRARTTPNASLSSASTSTDALKGKSCLSWSATAWGTWASPLQDMVRIDSSLTSGTYSAEH